MAGGITILSTGLLGAYHAAGGMVGNPRFRRSFLILTMVQVSRDRSMISSKCIADQLMIESEGNFHRYRNYHHCVFGQ